MKIIICITAFLLTFTSIKFSQSVFDFPAGSALTLDSGSDISADIIIINGTYNGGGTINGSTAYILRLTAYIEGFYNSSSNTMVSDTIIVYLRNTTTPFAQIDSAKSVLNTSGVGTFIFSNITNGTNYYINIRHRNSIETWSAGGQSFTTFSMIYDFSNASSQAYGNNMKQVNTSPDKFGIYSGNVNQDGVVDLTDLSLIDNDVYNFISGYVNTDVNGDEFVDLTDLTITDNNAFNFVIVIRPGSVSYKLGITND